MLGQQHPGLPGTRCALPADPHGAEQSRSVPSGRASPCPVRSAHSICCWAPRRARPGTAGSNYSPSAGEGKGDLGPRFMSCREEGARGLSWP